MSENIYKEKSWIIQNCFWSTGKNLSSPCADKQWWINRGKLYLYDLINFSVDDCYSFKNKIYLFINELHHKECPSCGEKVVNWSNLFCSKDCLYRSDVRKKMTTNWITPEETARKVQKIKETKLEKYGNSGYCNPEKSKASYFAKHGVENCSQLSEIKERRKKTCLEKYGSEHYGSSVQGRKHISEVRTKGFLDKFEEPELLSKESLEELYSTLNCYQIAEKLKVSPSWVSQTLHKHGIPVSLKYNEPKEETDIVNFIKTFYDGEIILHDRNILQPKEIDIFIPEKNLAIEHNGVYWHSERKIGKKYHLDKTISCEEKGIQLLHIFDTEWHDKKDIWKSIIKNKLGFHDAKIGARQTNLKLVTDRNLVNKFLSENHLQGQISSFSISIGLFFEEELVSLMVFGKSRFNKKYEYELLRFCNKLNTVVIGAASKIMKYFKKEYCKNSISVISYADRRYSNGSLYESLNMEFKGNSSPNYFYITKGSLESRMKYQKHKLAKILEKFNPDESEYQNMLNNGIDRIWDSGNKIYVC
jgi:hypothetical protein